MSHETPTVTFVTRKWPPSIGGMETYSKRLSEELMSLTKVRVIFLRGRSDGLVKTGLPLIGFGVKTAIKLLLGTPTDVTHFADMSLWPLALVARMRSSRSKLFISAHGTDVSYARRGGTKARLYARYLKMGARLLPQMTVIANSSATAQAAKQCGFLKTQVIPLGTDYTAEDEADVLHTKYEIFFAGRLIKLKGLSWFVNHVLPLLPAEYRLRVAGTIWDEAEAEALNDPRVEFLGHLQQEDLQKEFQRASCVIMPNVENEAGDFEGFGLIALEAAAAGGVVIASRHGGLEGAVKNEETGFLLESGNPDAWAQKIIDINGWTNDDRSSFITHSRKIVSSEYSWKCVAQKTHNIYEME